MGRAEHFSGILQQFRELITNGTWEPGLQLPTEQEMARRHQRCRGTIRKILVHLQADGLIRSEAGKGHFVRGGRVSPEGCPDVSLVMGLDCANWESEIAGVRLHELLAERVAQEGGRLRHIQFPVDDDGLQALQDIAADPTTNVVIVSKPWPTRFAEIRFFEQASRLGKRLIVLDYMLPRSPWHTHIFVDWSAGARLLIRHLAGIGRNRFLYAGFDGNDWSDERRAAVTAEIASAGLHLVASDPLGHEVPSGRPIDAPTLESVSALTMAVLRRQNVDTVICANDHLARRLIEHHGLPQEKVTGFDNSAWAREVGLLSPGISHPRVAEAILGECWSPRPATHAKLIPVPPHLPLHAHRAVTAGPGGDAANVPAARPRSGGTSC